MSRRPHEGRVDYSLLVQLFDAGVYERLDAPSMAALRSVCADSRELSYDHITTVKLRLYPGPWSEVVRRAQTGVRTRKRLAADLVASGPAQEARFHGRLGHAKTLEIDVRPSARCAVVRHQLIDTYDGAASYLSAYTREMRAQFEASGGARRAMSGVDTLVIASMPYTTCDSLAGLVGQLLVAGGVRPATLVFGDCFSSTAFDAVANACDLAASVRTLRTPALPRYIGGTLGTRIERLELHAHLDAAALARAGSLFPNLATLSARLPLLSVTSESENAPDILRAEAAPQLSHLTHLYLSSERAEGSPKGCLGFGCSDLIHMHCAMPALARIDSGDSLIHVCILNLPFLLERCAALAQTGRAVLVRTLRAALEAMSALRIHCMGGPGWLLTLPSRPEALSALMAEGGALRVGGSEGRTPPVVRIFLSVGEPVLDTESEAGGVAERWAVAGALLPGTSGVLVEVVATSPPGAAGPASEQVELKLPLRMIAAVARAFEAAHTLSVTVNRMNARGRSVSVPMSHAHVRDLCSLLATVPAGGRERALVRLIYTDATLGEATAVDVGTLSRTG